MSALFKKEHYQLMVQFERCHGGRKDRESKELWHKGIVYQDGVINQQFLSFRQGFAYAQAETRPDIQSLESARDGYRDDARILHEALSRMVAMYEAEYDHENPSAWRPDWLRRALLTTNALEPEISAAKEEGK